MFTIIEVDRHKSEAIEDLGAKRKFWFTNSNGQRMLFKAEERGTGDDWAEKIACKLCSLLDLPHVTYHLALESDVNRQKKVRGVVCETCVPSQWRLVHGNELLNSINSNDIASKKYAATTHTVKAVVDAVKKLSLHTQQKQICLPKGIESALDVFTGYIMLDTWIANQDRHHQNWAALQYGNQYYLAPTFDHGASMARNITDKEREERMNSQDVRQQIPYFAGKARTAFYEDSNKKKTMKTIDAWQAFSRESPSASEIWLNKLRAIDNNTVYKLLKEVPKDRMSEITCNFTAQLLNENRKRLLDGDYI